MRLDDAHDLLLLSLAEVELQQRAGVGGGRGGTQHLLWLVDVAERDVLGRRGQGGGRDAIGLADVQQSLGAIDGREQRAIDEEVPSEDVDRVRSVAVGERFAHRTVELRGALGVALELLVREAEHLDGVDYAPFLHPRDRRDAGCLLGCRHGQDAALVRAADEGLRLHAEQLREPPERIELARAVVVAGDQHDIDAQADELAQHLVQQPVGLRRG